MNKNKNLTISICFEEDTITELFSALLRAKGVKTRVVNSPKELSEKDINSGTKIITEPQYIPLVPEVLKYECMVVGNKESLKGLPGITLSRPLTEQKIELAIEDLLS
jgi:hypothetical protein